MQPSIDKYQVKGALKHINGKPKLAWQFQMSVQEFEALFEKLKDAQLIEPTKLDTLSAFFKKVKPALCHHYQLRSRGNCHSPIERTITKSFRSRAL